MDTTVNLIKNPTVKIKTAGRPYKHADRLFVIDRANKKILVHHEKIPTDISQASAEMTQRHE